MKKGMEIGSFVIGLGFIVLAMCAEKSILKQFNGALSIAFFLLTLKLIRPMHLAGKEARGNDELNMKQK